MKKTSVYPEVYEVLSKKKYATAEVLSIYVAKLLLDIDRGHGPPR